MTAPTTRETADHAELARLAEDKANAHIRNLRLAASRDFAVSGYSDGLIVEQDMRGMLLAAAESLDSLLSEIAALRGEVERLARINADHCSAVNTYVISNARLEDRATQAERQRDELRKALEAVISDCNLAAAACDNVGPRAGFHHVANDARQALANQGADQ